MLIDSNLLVYAINRSSPKHQAAQAFLVDNSTSLVVAQQNILETFRVLTHSKFASPMTPSAAVQAIKGITSACRLIHPNRTTLHVAIGLVQKHKLSGDQVFDAYLAATALSGDVTTIATANTRDFVRFDGLRLIDPFV